MSLILVRHAHRNTADRSLDNGLSEKGAVQARKIQRYFKNRFGKNGRGVILVSSPKRRCHETLAPIARYLGVEILDSELLDEKRPKESAQGLKRRVSRFLRSCRKSKKTWVICSHGDWIPIAIQSETGAASEPKKGSWTEIDDGKLIRLLQPEDL